MTGGAQAGLVVEIVQVGVFVRAVAGNPRLRQPQGERGALTLGAPHRDLPAVRGGHVFDDREPQARAAGGTGASGVDAIEALEHALPVLLGDADALVGDGDLDVVPAGRGHPAGGYAYAGACRAVVHGVLDKVSEGGGQLAPVPPDVQVGGAACGHGDLFGAGLVPAAVDGLGDQFVHADRFGVLKGIVVLDPGEVDQFLHEVGEPRGLDLHTAGEALDRLRVVRGVHDGLGQEEERADGCLQLVAHVRDEVAPYRFDTAGLGEVLHQQEHQPGAERGDARGDGECIAPPCPPPRQIQLDLPYLPVPPCVPGHLQHRLHGEPAAADQAEGVRRRAGLDDRVGLVEDDGRRTEHGKDGVHARRKHRVGVERGAGGALLLPLAPAERQHGDDTGEHPGDRCCCGDRRVHVHASRLGMRYDIPTAVEVRPRTLVAQSSPWSQ